MDSNSNSEDSNESPTTLEPFDQTRQLIAGTHIRYFGDFELVAQIGRGGMGIIYKARQISLDRTVALKMILAGHHATPADILRFRTEAQAAANLDHPNIVPIYEVGEHEGQQYFSMKFIEGTSLAKHISDFVDAPRETAELLVKIARAVHHAHQRGVIHRDLKPANVLIDTQGTPFVADFGLAKRSESDADLTHSNAVIGTPAYMSPEQAYGRINTITTLSDVYSLGAILYELLTGHPPFCGATPIETVLQVRQDEPERPSRRHASTDRSLEAICLKCLEKDPTQRYPSAGELADDLERWLKGEPVSVLPASTAFLVWLWLRSHLRASAWVAVIGLLCGVVGPLGLALRFFAPILRDMNHAYYRLPVETFHNSRNWSHTWLHALNIDPPGWFISLLIVIGGAIFLSCGFLIQMSIRPKDHSGDLLTGVATGCVAGVTAFMLFLGPMSVVYAAIVRTQHDLLMLGEAYRTWSPLLEPHDAAGLRTSEEFRISQAQLLTRYRYLHDLPDRDRVKLLTSHLRVDMIFGVCYGLWWSAFSSVVGSIVACSTSTAICGALRRSHPWTSTMSSVRDLPRFLCYVELVFLGELCCVLLISPFFRLHEIQSTQFEMDSQVSLPTVAFLAGMSMFVSAAAGVTWRWPWYVRYPLYAILMGDAFMFDPGSKANVFGHFAFAASVVIIFYAWKRHQGATRS